MTPEDILEEASIDTGWDEADQRKLLLEFVEELNLEDQFEAYVLEQVDKGSVY